MEQPQRPDLWLQSAASLAMSALLARLDLEAGARPYFWIDTRQSPPQASHSYWDAVDIAGRFVDALPLAREITGRDDGRDSEALLREYLWAQQDGKDGLFYNRDDEARPGDEMSKYTPDGTEAAGARHVDLFCQRGPAMALCTLMAAGDRAAPGRWEKLVEGLWGLTERAAPDELRLPSYRWAPVLKPEWIASQTVPEKWLGYRYAALTALARGAELTGSPRSVELARGLAHWYMRHGDVPADGRYAANTHSGGILPTAVGICRLGIQAGDAEMVAWAQRVYEWTRANTADFGFLLDGLGLDGFFAGTCETCGLADLVHLALLLTQAGAGDCWGDIERIARNQLTENQYADREALRRLYPGVDETVLRMLHGGFECAATPNRLLTYTGVEACCIGGGMRALYHVWRGAVTDRGEQTDINLGFSRSTPHVEVIGHEPWQGRIDVRLRTSRRLSVRAPEHVQPEEAEVTIDGRRVCPHWEGRRAHLGRLSAGQIASLTYPLRDRQARYEIAGTGYSGWWRGGTMVEIEPAGDGYGAYRRRHLLEEGGPSLAPLPWTDETPPPPLPLWD